MYSTLYNKMVSSLSHIACFFSNPLYHHVLSSLLPAAGEESVICSRWVALALPDAALSQLHICGLGTVVKLISHMGRRLMTTCTDQAGRWTHSHLLCFPASSLLQMTCAAPAVGRGWRSQTWPWSYTHPHVTHWWPLPPQILISPIIINGFSFVTFSSFLYNFFFSPSDQISQQNWMLSRCFYLKIKYFWEKRLKQALKHFQTNDLPLR